MSSLTNNNIATSAAAARKKRPLYQSPVPSFKALPAFSNERRTSGGVVASKRARWDVSSPMPSPPILSVPLPSTQSPATFAFATSASQFKFGLDVKKPIIPPNRGNNAERTKTIKRDREVFIFNDHESDDDEDKPNMKEHSIRTAMALDRLRRTIDDESEDFVQRMRQWENRERDPSSSSSRSGGGVGAMMLDVPSYSSSTGRSRSDTGSTSVSSSTASSPLPSMSNSITSNSSNSNSDGLSLGRKRSWREDGDDGDMEWEVVVQDQPISGDLPSSSTRRNGGTVASASASTFGDDERNHDEDDEDDDLVFVSSSSDNDNTGTIRAPTTTTTTTTTTTHRTLADLTQVMAAGAGSLEDYHGPHQTSHSHSFRAEEVGNIWK